MSVADDWNAIVVKFRELVEVIDQGVVDWSVFEDPDDGPPIKRHMISFFLTKDDVQYGLSLSEDPELMREERFYRELVARGCYTLIKEAGLL